MILDKRRPTFLDAFDSLIALGFGIFSFACYIRTLVPGLLPNDGAEFQTLAYTVDHAHTTGYEVYTLLARMFTLLVPVGDIAYRVNLLSAFYAALTVAFVYLAGRVLTGSRWGAAVGAFALLISATFWSQSVIAEVYTAGSVFTSAILLLLLGWYRTGSGRLIFMAALLGGLGIGMHGSNSLFAPAILVLLLLGRPGQSGPWPWANLRRVWQPALAGAGLGVALMAAAFVVVDANPSQASIFNVSYLPSISRWDMQPADLSTLSGRFSFLVFARQWRSAMFTNPVRVMPQNAGKFIETLPQDFALIILLFIPLGLIALFTRQWRLGIFFLLGMGVYLIYTFNYSIGDIYVFYIALYVYLSALVAEGSAILLRAVTWLSRRVTPWLPKLATPALGISLLVLAGFPFFSERITALQQGEIRFHIMNLPSNRQLEQWHGSISETVKHLDANAIVLMDWPDLYGYAYVAQVEQNRTDLLFIEAYPYSTKPGMAESLLQYLEEQASQRPIFAVRPMSELDQGGFHLHNEWMGSSRMFAVIVQ